MSNWPAVCIPICLGDGEGKIYGCPVRTDADLLRKEGFVPPHEFLARNFVEMIQILMTPSVSFVHVFGCSSVLKVILLDGTVSSTITIPRPRLPRQQSWAPGSVVDSVSPLKSTGVGNSGMMTNLEIKRRIALESLRERPPLGPPFSLFGVPRLSRNPSSVTSSSGGGRGGGCSCRTETQSVTSWDSSWTWSDEDDGSMSYSYVDAPTAIRSANSDCNPEVFVSTTDTLSRIYLGQSAIFKEPPPKKKPSTSSTSRNTSSLRSATMYGCPRTIRKCSGTYSCVNEFACDMPKKKKELGPAVLQKYSPRLEEDWKAWRDHWEIQEVTVWVDSSHSPTPSHLTKGDPSSVIVIRDPGPVTRLLLSCFSAHADGGGSNTSTDDDHHYESLYDVISPPSSENVGRPSGSPGRHASPAKSNPATPKPKLSESANEKIRKLRRNWSLTKSDIRQGLSRMRKRQQGGTTPVDDSVTAVPAPATGKDQVTSEASDVKHKTWSIKSKFRRKSIAPVSGGKVGGNRKGALGVSANSVSAPQIGSSTFYLTLTLSGDASSSSPASPEVTDASTCPPKTPSSPLLAPTTYATPPPKSILNCDNKSSPKSPSSAPPSHPPPAPPSTTASEYRVPATGVRKVSFPPSLPSNAIYAPGSTTSSVGKKISRPKTSPPPPPTNLPPKRVLSYPPPTASPTTANKHCSSSDSGFSSVECSQNASASGASASSSNNSDAASSEDGSTRGSTRRTTWDIGTRTSSSDQSSSSTLWLRSRSGGDSTGGGDGGTLSPTDEEVFHSSSTFLEDEPLYQFYNASTLLAEYPPHADYEEIPEGVLSDSVHPVAAKVEDTPLVASHSSAMDLVTQDGPQRTFWRDAPQVRNSGIIGRISQKERELQEAIFEVITSEASYLKSLNVLVDHFIAGLGKKAIPEKDIRDLFSDIIPVRDASARFLEDLERRWQEDVYIRSINDIIISHSASNFDVYVKFCSNQIHRQKRISELESSLPLFKEELTRLESDPRCKKLPMNSFLMLPMQRITRLPILVNAILSKVQQGSEEHAQCRRAMDMLNQVAQNCNEGARKREQEVEMLQLSSRIEFGDGRPYFPISSSSRHLVKKGSLCRLMWANSDTHRRTGKRPQKQTLYLFLFNDVLLITKRKGTGSEETYNVVDFCNRNAVMARTHQDDLPGRLPEGTCHLVRFILLKNWEDKTAEYIFACSAENDQMRWVEAMTSRTDAEDVITYQDWDCPKVRVTKHYKPREEDELSLTEGEVVSVLQKSKDQWFHGERERDGKRGWFPAAYSQEIPSEHVRARNLHNRFKVLENLGHSFTQFNGKEKK
ncbi:unnamed protein product [Cyprideis torosa]|uniref:Uncharacterized protein n=1 Tax=Cyprideis torosa TaxID=163714 RepID=A0A7R8W4N1_9CRUS|nr:unnamed protein product [Cyprideis torosa]CAG0879001.1 unnamed protein product [Cyprideis torosa]